MFFYHPAKTGAVPLRNSSGHENELHRYFEAANVQLASQHSTNDKFLLAA